jgi:aminodeoxyfutalosine synthase
MAVLMQSGLDAIWEKVESDERLDFEDGLALMESDDVLQLGELADAARRRRGGSDDVYFVQNLYLNQTNVCRVKCKFCAFAVTQKQPEAYTHSPAELVDDALRQRELTGFTEIHMVGGESPHVGFDYYVEIVARLHEAMPDVHLKCFTASEIHHMTKLSGLSHEQVLRELRDAGLGSLPGGGAEVFADRVRRLVAPGKEHPDFWLHTHRTAHRLGIPTHCTMLYGHVETYEERVDHLLRLRELQDETAGFLAFIPLAFHPQNTVFERRGWTFTPGSEDLKLIAVSRLLLDNVPHVKAYWIMMGLPLAQIALHFGADDVQGTVVREEIFHAAGARTETEQKIEELVRVIQAAGRIPVQRDTLYNELRRWPQAQSEAAA